MTRYQALAAAAAAGTYLLIVVGAITRASATGFGLPEAARGRVAAEPGDGPAGLSVPRGAWAYLSLTKPRIILLLLITALGGMVLAADGLPPLGTDIFTLVGGVLSAGPDRLEAVGRAGIPQVVSLGALDMVNFGARDTVPAQFEDRNLYVHNPTVTLMRTTPEENAELGRRIARKLNGASSPTVLFVPLRGVSAIDIDGQPFRDAEADEALFAALREGVDTSKVEVHEVDADVNDPAFATAMADRLHELVALERPEADRHDQDAGLDAPRR
jgi:hypothetical protein